MVRRYVSMANMQRSLIDRRSSPMDLIAHADEAPEFQEGAQEEAAEPKR